MKTLAVRIFVVLIGLCVPAQIVHSHGGDTSLIHGCLNNKGAVRIVGATVACKSNETARDWNISGPTGPQGPQGPSDLFKFVGFSTGSINGGQGMLQMHAVCQVDYGSSARMCTSKEFWLSPNATAPTTNPAWLHPSTSDGNDFSAPGGSCVAWTDGTSNAVGLVVGTSGKPEFSHRCDFQGLVTCCVP
jgi:hypothetical protein